MTIAEFDNFEIEKKKNLLKQCCGSSVWVSKMLTVFPVEDLVDLMEDAEEKWYECTEEDWKEAFSHHPEIGDIDSLKKKFSSTDQWAEGEQSGVNNATEKILQGLADGNKMYRRKFGYIFIISATDKSAEEILSLLQARLLNSPAEEIKIAMEEQNLITKIRLEKLIA